MPKKKNKQRNIAKRIQRAVENKKVKRKRTLAKLQKDQQRVLSSGSPPQSEIDAPKGFRAIANNLAIAEYAKPVMEKAQSEEELQGAMQAAMVFWNYSIALNEQDAGPMLVDMEQKILKALRDSFKMDEASGKEFLQMMVDRHHQLFPKEIQPKGAPFMFMRKDVSYLIRPVEGS